jgi:hypothetical protein
MGQVIMAAGQMGMSLGAAGQQAGQQNATGMYNQGIARMQAKEIEQKTAFDQVRQTEEGSRQMSSMEVAQASGGGGYNLLALAKQRSELELENLNIGREGAIAASKARAEGSMARWQGKMASKQTWMGAVGSSMGRFSDMMGKQSNLGWEQ